jgi:hypothetical protein
MTEFQTPGNYLEEIIHNDQMSPKVNVAGA